MTPREFSLTRRLMPTTLGCTRRCIALREGPYDWEALEAFAAHPYQCQSGPGLLMLASAYRRAGRQEAAAQAEQWARERDPECAAVSTLV